ncbi:MAG: hypothetical protein L7U72_17675 [Rubripirellula sp.]|nr:hypothetical protein [Rubripirellula sp.]
MLQQRSKLLLLGLAVAVLGVRIYDMAESLLLKPLSDRQVQVEDLETELLAQKRLAVRIEQAEAAYQDWLGKTLPARQSEAATLYQNWLVDACSDASFDDAQVTPSAGEDLALGMKTLSFSVTAVTDYAGLQYFLMAVDETPLMHQVSEVSVRLAETEYDDRLDAQIQLDCMIVDGAENRSELLTELVRDEVGRVMKSRQQDQVRDRDSPFLIVKEIAKPDPIKPDPTVMVTKDPVKPIVVAPPPKPDYSDQIIQVGTVLNTATREVWVMDRRTNEQVVVQEGGDFDFYGIRGRVQSVTARYVVIELEGKRYRWMLASSLKERESIERKKRSAS